MNSSGNSAVVSAMLAAWGSGKVDEVLQYFSDDALYCNIPMGDPYRGKAQIGEALTGFFGAYSGFDFEILHQAENAQGIVLNERSDRFLKGENWLTLPVMGVFELEGGVITYWRDYFDLAQLKALDPEMWGS